MTKQEVYIFLLPYFDRPVSIKDMTFRERELKRLLDGRITEFLKLFKWKSTLDLARVLGIPEKGFSPSVYVFTGTVQNSVPLSTYIYLG